MQTNWPSGAIRTRGPMEPRQVSDAGPDDGRTRLPRPSAPSSWRRPGRGPVAALALAAALIAAACGGTFNWGTSADTGRAASEAHDFATYGMDPAWAGYGAQFAAFCVARFGFDCEVTRGRQSLAPDMTSAEAISAFEDERDHPRAVLADISIQLGPAADARGVSAPYVADGAARLPAELYGSGGGWVATYAAAPAFLVDLKDLAGRGLDPPASWQDLASPRYRGLVAMAQPVESGTATDAVISVFVAAGATLDAPGPGLAICRGLRANLVSPLSFGPNGSSSATAGSSTSGWPATVAGAAAPATVASPGLAAATPSPRAARSARPSAKVSRAPATTSPSPSRTSEASASAAASQAPAGLPVNQADPFAAAGAPILVLLDVRAAQLAATLGSGRADVIIPSDGGAWAVGGLLINRYAVGQGDVAKAFVEWSLSDDGQAVIETSGLHAIREVAADPKTGALLPPARVGSAAGVGGQPATAYARIRLVSSAAWTAARVGELWDGACAGSG